MRLTEIRIILTTFLSFTSYLTKDSCKPCVVVRWVLSTWRNKGTHLLHRDEVSTWQRIKRNKCTWWWYRERVHAVNLAWNWTLSLQLPVCLREVMTCNTTPFRYVVTTRQRAHHLSFACFGCYSFASNAVEYDARTMRKIPHKKINVKQWIWWKW